MRPHPASRCRASPSLCFRTAVPQRKKLDDKERGNDRGREDGRGCGRGRDGGGGRANLRRRGLSGGAAGHRRSAARPWRGRDQEEPRTACRARQAQARGARCDASAHRAHDQDRGSRRLRRRRRGRARALRPQEGGIREPRPRLPGRGDPRHQHLLDLGHPHRLDLEGPEPRHRHAFLQSSANDAARGDHPGIADEGRNLRQDRQAHGGHRQEGARVEGFPTASSSIACSCR